MPTFQSLYQTIQSAIGDESADTLSRIQEFLNEGQRVIWNAHGWYFRKKKARFNTVAPYTTGTITATQSSTTLSISGGSLTGLEGYKFSLGASSPYYRILSVAVGGLSATLEVGYAGTTVTTSTFLIYKDEYELPTSVKSMISAKVLRSGWEELEYIDADRIDSFMSTQQLGTGVPRFYNSDGVSYSISTSPNSLHMWLAPVPDDIHPVEYTYLASVTDMSDDDDTPSLPDEFIPCLKQYGLALAYQLDYQMAEQGIAARQLFEANLEELKRTYKAENSVVYRIQPCDAHYHRPSMADNIRRSFNI